MEETRYDGEVDVERELTKRAIQYAYKGHTVKIKGVGDSMRPLLKNERDYIYLRKIIPGELRKGDVVLYQTGGLYVLHRVYQVRGNEYTMLGDGNLALEPGIQEADIYLKAVGFERNGRYIDIRKKSYRLYSAVWGKSRRIRSILRRGIGKLKRVSRTIRRIL